MQTFSAYYTDKLGQAIRIQALEQCPDGYPMTIKNQDEVDAIVAAWNQGIDSHLEAITERSSYNQISRGVSFNIHPEELHVLIRRLMDSGSEAGESLASAICSTLDIELI